MMNKYKNKVKRKGKYRIFQEKLCKHIFILEI
jgi:hypothetical protein